jgi:carbon storage regulator
MLVLSRKIGEVITIGTSVKITVLSYDRGIVRLGIEAPKSIPVHRKEVFDKIIELNKQASKTELATLKTILSKSELLFTEGKTDVIDAPTVNFSSNQENN